MEAAAWLDLTNSESRNSSGKPWQQAIRQEQHQPHSGENHAKNLDLRVVTALNLRASWHSSGTPPQVVVAGPPARRSAILRPTSERLARCQKPRKSSRGAFEAHGALRVDRVDPSLHRGDQSPSRREKSAGSDPPRRCDRGTPIVAENHRFSGGRSRLSPDTLYGSGGGWGCAVWPMHTGIFSSGSCDGACDTGCDREPRVSHRLSRHVSS